MKDVFISIPITSFRFISITWARSLEPANCSAKQCQWHFKGSQRLFDGILMLSGFGGFQRRAWWAGGFEVEQQWQNATPPPLTASTATTYPLSFFRVLAQGWNNCARHGLGSPKSLTDDSRGEGGLWWGEGVNFFFLLFYQLFWHSSCFQAKPPLWSLWETFQELHHLRPQLLFHQHTSKFSFKFILETLFLRDCITDMKSDT